jgi:segregation and condensation protein B
VTTPEEERAQDTGTPGREAHAEPPGTVPAASGSTGSGDVIVGLDAETRAAVAAAFGQTIHAEEINDSIDDLIPTVADNPTAMEEGVDGAEAQPTPTPADESVAEPTLGPTAEPPAEPAHPAAEPSAELPPAGVVGVEPAAEPLSDASGLPDDDGVVRDPLPDLTEDVALQAALEALLLVIDGPADEESLADALDQPVKRIRRVLTELAQQYHEQDRGIDLRNVGGGWRFHTRDKFAPFVEKLLLGGQRAKLTRAALESLAVIAYRQPVTRARVAAVRGVNVDGVVRTLILRGLIEEAGTDKDTGGILYRTTELFLERLGLSSLTDLPPIAPLLPEVDAIDDV